MPSRQRIIYLVQESFLFLAFSYLVLLGGTFNGLVISKLNTVNLVLIIFIGVTWLSFRFIKNTRANRTGVDLGVTLILLAGLISTAFSIDPRRSIIGLVILIIAVLIFYLFVDLIRMGLDPQLINKVLILVSGFILFFGIWEMIAWYSGWIKIAGIEKLIPEATYRVRAFLGHPNFLAAYLNLLIPIVLAYLIKTKNKATKIGLSFWLIVALVLVFFTSSRGGWLGTFVALGVFSFGVLITKGEWIKQKLTQLKGNKVILVVFCLAIIGGIGGIYFLLKWQSSHPTHPTDWSNILGSRDYIWIVARDMFRADPISGNGLFTFGSEYLKTESIPPNMLLAHAHNYYLNVAGEQGIVGLVALAVYVISLLIVVLKAFKQHKYLSKIEITGLCAAIFGMAAHSFFETPQSLPVLLILPAIIVAQITAGLEWNTGKNNPVAKNLFLFGLWVSVTIFISYDCLVLRNYDKGLELAAGGNWEGSLGNLERVTEQDPKNGLYWFQRAYIEGMIALGENGDLRDENSLQNAIESYNEGLEIESNYSVHWMNLGVLYKAQGKFDRAKDAMEMAVRKSPVQPDFLMTLGNLYEITGQEQKAKDAYLKALQLRPEWINIQYFQENSIRKNVIDKWLGESTNGEGSNDEIDMIHKYYSQGYYQETMHLLESLDKFNNPELYELLGRTYIQLGEYQKAEKNLRTALWMGPTDKAVLIKIYWDLGVNSLHQGHDEKAGEAFLMADSILNRKSSYGIGKLGETQYSWYLFYKNSIKQDVLPGVISPVYSDGMIEGLTFMVDYYRSNQQNELAALAMVKLCNVRRDLLDVESGLQDECTR